MNRHQHAGRRDEIVAALREIGCATIAQLAERVGISAQAVRLHLAALLRDGVIERVVQPARIGRPPEGYRLKNGS